MSKTLIPSELYKYETRVQTFIKNYRDGNPFELVDGSFVSFVYDKDVEKLLLANAAYNKIRFLDVQGISYKLSQIKKTSEYGSNHGSGLGSQQTFLYESAQALVCAQEWGDRSLAYIPCIEDTSRFLDGLTIASWKYTLDTTAQLLYDRYGNCDYEWHYHSYATNCIYKTYNRVRDGRKYFHHYAKWNPSDIWGIRCGYDVCKDLNRIDTLPRLNEYMKRAMCDGLLFGVSLKMMQHNANGVLAQKNVSAYDDAKKKHWTAHAGKVGFFSSKDIVYVSDSSSFQFRAFPEYFQGELKGCSANHGKISHGPISQILVAHGKPPLPSQKEFRSRVASPDTIQKVYGIYCTIENDYLPYDVFYNKCISNGELWMYSKFMGMILSQVLNDDILSECERYASSSSLYSSAFLKIEQKI